ncbi:MAG TPA: hypothetical protein VGK31_08100, partial [Thermoanaerobaculia bacterium]
MIGVEGWSTTIVLIRNFWPSADTSIGPLAGIASACLKQSLRRERAEIVSRDSHRRGHLAGRKMDRLHLGRIG